MRWLGLTWNEWGIVWITWFQLVVLFPTYSLNSWLSRHWKTEISKSPRVTDIINTKNLSSLPLSLPPDLKNIVFDYRGSMHQVLAIYVRRSLKDRILITRNSLLSQSKGHVIECNTAQVIQFRFIAYLVASFLHRESIFSRLFAWGGKAPVLIARWGKALKTIWQSWRRTSLLTSLTASYTVVKKTTAIPTTSHSFAHSVVQHCKSLLQLDHHRHEPQCVPRNHSQLQDTNTYIELHVFDWHYSIMTCSCVWSWLWG